MKVAVQELPAASDIGLAKWKRTTTGYTVWNGTYDEPRPSSEFFDDWQWDAPAVSIEYVPPVQDTDAPTVSSVAVTSDPGTDSAYAIGDAVEVSATFSEAVTVEGQLRLTINIGGQPKPATYDRGSGTASIVFSYTVEEGDLGVVAIGSGAITLNGGSIEAGDDDRAADLSHDAQTSSHPVDGERPTPDSAAVDGSTLTLTYSESLDGDSEPPASAFSVSVAGATRAVSGVSVSGGSVTLTLATAVTADDTVTVSYTPPAGDSATQPRAMGR